MSNAQKIVLIFRLEYQVIQPIGLKRLSNHSMSMHTCRSKKQKRRKMFYFFTSMSTYRGISRIYFKAVRKIREERVHRVCCVELMPLCYTIRFEDSFEKTLFALIKAYGLQRYGMCVIYRHSSCVSRNIQEQFEIITWNNRSIVLAHMSFSHVSSWTVPVFFRKSARCFLLYLESLAELQQ